jgi:hypothetical protein
VSFEMMQEIELDVQMIACESPQGIAEVMVPLLADITPQDVLDLSDLLDSGEVQMDSLDHYLHFEQEGDNLLVYIDEGGSFTQESFNLENATEIVTLVDTNIQSTHYEDIMKELLDNNQIIT